MLKHYLVGGSTAERTMHCSAWATHIDSEKDDSSTAADIGTLCHNAMEGYYSDGLELDEMIGSLSFKEHMLSEHLVESLVIPAIEMVANAAHNFKWSKEYFEKTIEFDKDFGGTADIITQSETNDDIFIVDYKFGSKKVDVGNNIQLMTYAFLALTDKYFLSELGKPRDVHLMIIQPKISSRYSHHQTTINDVYAHGAALLDAKDRLFDPNIKKKEKGDWCYFCPGKNFCEVYRAPSKKLNALREFTKNSLDTNKKSLFNAK